MKILIGVVAALASTSSIAQTTVSGIGMNSPNYSTFQSSLDGLGGWGMSETPTMRAEKLRQAIDLRREANALLAQDGGKLTLVHETYVRRRVCKILGFERTDTGNLAPQRRCGV